MNSRLFPLLLVLAIALAPGLASAEEGDPAVDALLEKLATSYADVTTVQASFVQTSTGMSYMEPLVQKGTLALKKPGRIRWVFTEPTPQRYLSDGSTLWVVNDVDKTCTVFRMLDETMGLYFDFLTGMKDARAHFALRVIEPTADADVLEAKPLKKDSALGTLHVRIDKATGRVSGVVNINPFGDQTEVKLSDIVVGAELPDADFVWSGQEGYREMEGG
jgi:outer membrane lipoprotein carrier protein